MQRLSIRKFVLMLVLAAMLAACSGGPSQETPATATTGTANEANPAAAPETAGTGAAMQPRSPAVAEAPKPIVIPQGKAIMVRLNSALGSKISRPGDSFSATLAEAVMVDGKVAIPAGASAVGTVTDAKPLGRFKGGALLSLRLNSVSVGGKPLEVHTSSVTRTLAGKGKRTAVAVGGGAGLGALIGGLAGGGKGAAIGAGVGAGAGTAGAGLTGNKEIVLPAESAVSFRLAQPVQI